MQFHQKWKFSTTLSIVGLQLSKSKALVSIKIKGLEFRSLIGRAIFSKIMWVNKVMNSDMCCSALKIWEKQKSYWKF